MNDFNFSVLRYLSSIKNVTLFLLAFGITNFCHAQVGDSAAVAKTKRNRVIGISTVGATAFAGTLVALNYVRYNTTPNTKFHLVDNTPEWKGVGKVGHFALSSKITVNGYNALRWTGIKHTPALIYS